MDRFDKRENINNFQYLETKLDYINYENKYFSSQLDKSNLKRVRIVKIQANNL